VKKHKEKKNLKIKNIDEYQVDTSIHPLATGFIIVARPHVHALGSEFTLKSTPWKIGIGIGEG